MLKNVLIVGTFLTVDDERGNLLFFSTLVGTLKISSN